MAAWAPSRHETRPLKTKLCRNFQTKGYCGYSNNPGGGCRYAHHENELGMPRGGNIDWEDRTPASAKKRYPWTQPDSMYGVAPPNLDFTAKPVPPPPHSGIKVNHDTQCYVF